LDVHLMLNATRFLLMERDYTVWSIALRGFFRLSLLLRTTPDYSLFADYVRSRLVEIVEWVGWNSTESLAPDPIAHTTQLLRSSVLTSACSYDLLSARTTALSMFYSLFSTSPFPDPNPIPPELRAAVYDTGVRYGGETEWLWMYDQYTRARQVSAAEIARALSALAATRDISLLARLLSFSLDPNRVRSQDTVSVIQAVGSNPLGRRLTWDFIQDKWSELYERFVVGGSRSFGPLIGNVIRGFTTQREYDQISAFLLQPNPRDVGPGALSVTEGLANIANNILWLKISYQPIVDWLNAQLSSPIL